MAKLSIRIDYAEGDPVPTVTVTAATPFGKEEAKISFPINFDPSKPTPLPKKRKAETDADYKKRCEKDCPKEEGESDADYAKRLPNQCPRREAETDEQYNARLTTVNPTAIDLSPDFAAGLVERCSEIMDSVRDIMEHYGTRAAATHQLASQGKAPPGVKVLNIGGKLKPASQSKLEKK